MPKQLLGIVAAAIALTGAVSAQSPAAAPTFEVASVKPAPPLDHAKLISGKLHIGMSVDAARVDIGNVSLADLIRIAYRLKPHQLSGPDWMSSQRFDILAKMPEGATKEQVPEMLQALLAERFKLGIHRESKEHAMYALAVGKNGHKMKEAEPDPPAGTTPADDGGAGKGALVIGSGENQVRVHAGGEGKTIASGPFGQMKISMADGGMRMEFAKMNMAGLAEILTRFADKPVVDMTELKGNYQVALNLSVDLMMSVARSTGLMGGMMMGGAGPNAAGAGAPGATPAPADAASAPAGSSIFKAVQQLGLTLEPRKAPVDVIVIDHLEKTPTEN
jgi:uncharacterized protein (TIGR03435 family)